jgi:hypothetical protein
MLAHEVCARRLVGAGGQEGGLGQQLDLQRQQVAEDARQRDDHVDARPAQLLQRDQLGAGQAAVAVEARLGAHQRQRLGDRRAFGLQVVGAPQHEGDRLGERVAVGHVAASRRWPGARRPAPRRRWGCGRGRSRAGCARSAGWPGAQQVAAGRRAHVAAVQRVQDAGDLVVLGQQAVGGGQLAQQRDGRSASSCRRPRPPPGSGGSLRTSASMACAAGALLARGVRLRPGRPASPRARPVWAPCRPRAGRAGSACIRVPARRSRAGPHVRRACIVAPGGLGRGQFQLGGLGLHQRRQFGALGALRAPGCASARSRPSGRSGPCTGRLATGGVR